MSQSSRAKRGRKRSQGTMIDLLETGRILNQHLSESLCEEVFQTTRVAERERVWTLFTLLKFWTHIVLKSPGSLTEALEEGLRGHGKEWPKISGTPQAFFDRSKSLKWTFPENLYQRFVKAVTPTAAPQFAGEFAFLLTDVLESEKLTAEAALDLYVRRWDVEEWFELLKQHAGLGGYQGRKLVGAEHHVALAAVADLVLDHVRLGTGMTAAEAKMALQRLLVVETAGGERRMAVLRPVSVRDAEELDAVKKELRPQLPRVAGVELIPLDKLSHAA